MQVNELVLPLEPLLTSGAPLANSLNRLSAPGSLLTEGIVDRNPGHIHNILDQNHLSLKNTSSTLAETVPGLLVAVKHLHSCLSKLIGTASSDAGFLHKVGVYLSLRYMLDIEMGAHNGCNCAKQTANRNAYW